MNVRTWWNVHGWPRTMETSIIDHTNYSIWMQTKAHKNSSEVTRGHRRSWEYRWNFHYSKNCTWKPPRVTTFICPGGHRKWWEPSPSLCTLSITFHWPFNLHPYISIHYQASDVSSEGVTLVRWILSYSNSVHVIVKNRYYRMLVKMMVGNTSSNQGRIIIRTLLNENDAA